MMGYPQHPTQPRDNLFWRRGNFVGISISSTPPDFELLQPTYDIFINAAGNRFANLTSNIDVTKLVALAFDSEIITGGYSQVYIGTTSVYYSSSAHSWTPRLIDITTYSGLLNVRFQFHGGGTQFEGKYRNIRLY